jgi:heme-degrading monooxygenase HmoA
MQIHVAIYKWKAGSSPESIENALAKVKEVRNRVPGLLGIFVGPNTSKYGEGYTHAIVVVGEDEAALAAYRSDSLHQEAASEIDSMEDAGIGVDLTDRL